MNYWKNFLGSCTFWSDILGNIKKGMGTFLLLLCLIEAICIFMLYSSAFPQCIKAEYITRLCWSIIAIIKMTGLWIPKIYCCRLKQIRQFKKILNSIIYLCNLPSDVFFPFLSSLVIVITNWSFAPPTQLSFTAQFLSVTDHASKKADLNSHASHK